MEHAKEGFLQAAVEPGWARRRLDMAMTFIGVALCFSSLGLWLNPEDISKLDGTAMRATLTFLFVGCGWILFRMGRPWEGDEFTIDIERRKLVQVRRGKAGSAAVRSSHDLSEQEALAARGNVLVVRARSGTELLRVALPNPMPQGVIDRIAACRRGSEAT